MNSRATQTFVTGYTVLILGGLAVLWFRPTVTEWPAWVQAVGSIAAIIAAIWIAQWQAHLQRQKDDELRRRRETAVRAVTPLALTKLCGWATATTKAWRDAAAIMQDQPIGRPGLHGEGGAAAAAVTFGTAPDDAIRDVQAMIEASSAETAKPYVALLQVLQVQQTRALGYAADVGNPMGGLSAYYCLSQVIATAEVYARASELFDHARDQEAEDSTLVARREITRALLASGIYENIDAEITRLADLQFGPR